VTIHPLLYNNQTGNMKSSSLIDKFIYSCSHDLKSPVTSIQGLVRLADYYPHNSDIHNCLEMIEDCTTKMDGLLRKLQEYMTDSHHPVIAREVNVSQLFGSVREEFKNHLDLYHIDLILQVSVNFSWIMDADIILKILRYLVSNSVAYHDPGKKDKRIVIRIESNVKGSTVEVSDNGLGIEDEQQEKIFDVFYRATEKSIGRGMGLFLVNSLVEKTGGSISCQSSHGDGTKIRIYFPVFHCNDSANVKMLVSVNQQMYSSKVA
jgi:signal transduction histidine kinase